MPQRTLRMPKEEARQKLRTRLEKGRELESLGINSIEELEDYKKRLLRYTKYNEQMLAQILNDESIAFWKYSVGSPSPDSNPEDELEFYKKLNAEQINELQAIEESLDVLPEFKEQNQPAQQPSVLNQETTTINLPDKVSLAWLWHYVPYTLWFWLAGIVLGAFTLGVTVGQTTFIQELFGKKPATSSDSTKKGTGIIKGVVMGNSGSPLIGAHVIVKDSTLKTVYESYTDINGLYVTPGLQPNNYIVFVDVKGYKTPRIEAAVTADSETVINARLESVGSQ